MSNSIPACTWGTSELSTGDTLQCRFGSLQITVKRDTQQWQMAYRHVEETETAQDSNEEWSPESWLRFVFASTSGNLELRPALPDRSVVSRPTSPFHLPPLEQATIFITTPLWVQLRVHDSAMLLQEIASQRISDTWFGTSTMSGELCYATETRARLTLEESPAIPHKAITEVRLENQSDEPLLIERINLPAPFLTLYRDAAGDFRTESISVIRTQDGLLNNTGADGVPTDQLEVVSQPRQIIKSDLIADIFTTLFS